MNRSCNENFARRIIPLGEGDLIDYSIKQFVLYFIKLTRIIRFARITTITYNVRHTRVFTSKAFTKIFIIVIIIMSFTAIVLVGSVSAVDALVTFFTQADALVRGLARK